MTNGFQSDRGWAPLLGQSLASLFFCTPEKHVSCHRRALVGLTGFVEAAGKQPASSLKTAEEQVQEVLMITSAGTAVARRGSWGHSLWFLWHCWNRGGKNHTAAS